MARDDATVLTEAAFRELRRAYWQQKRELSNLKTRLAALGRPRQSSRTMVPRVKFQNTASETAPAWGLMRITTPTSGAEYLSCAKPDSTYRWLYMVNGPKDVAPSSYGYGHFLTAETFSFRRGYVLYDTGATPAYGEEWGPKDDSWLLWQHRPGFLIIGATKGSGSAARLVALQQHPGEILVYNAGSAIAAAGSGTATLYGGTSGSESSLGMTVTVRNRSSTSWASSKYGIADLINGQAYVSPQQT